MFKFLFNDLFHRSDFLEEKRSGKVRTLIHSRVGEIVYRKNCRNRYIRISLRPHRKVLVTLPARCSYADADRLVAEKMEWITAKQAELNARHSNKKTYCEDEIKELRQQAKTQLPQRIMSMAEQYGFAYSAASFKKMYSRWGSCSAANKLNFSIFLMLLPDNLIDYVILHELCHTIHKNHGKEFWNLLDSVTQGQARLLAKQIKTYSYR